MDLFDFESYKVCESCLLGKMTKASFTGHSERASDLLGLMHTNVYGLISSQARWDFHYFITFTNDFSRYGHVYLMKHKSKSFKKFKKFKNEIQNQLSKSIKELWLDQGGEYLSQEFDNYLKECAIISQLTPPRTPQWNGVSKKRNHTLFDIVWSMMSQTNLSISFQGHTLKTVAFTLNRVLSKLIQMTTYEIWTRKCSSLSFMKI